MICKGCYKLSKDGYCLRCRKRLFFGIKIAPVLGFDAPTAANLPQFQEQGKRLSISGVQLKYSLRLENNALILTEKGGQYLLKPIPPSRLLKDPEQAPENEHLTMQIAEQVFGISTAANALVYFNNGTPAYLTKRFDINADGTKNQQEDMAQLLGRSRFTHGEDFKYNGSYDTIGSLIRQFVAAYPAEIESFFRLVLFNYLFSNGDAHLKNFSLTRSIMGDYVLTPAYDLLSTILHSPLESDTALELYDRSMDGTFYGSYGYYGMPEFILLAEKLGIKPVRQQRIFATMLSSQEKIAALVEKSFASEAFKKIYIDNYQDRLARLPFKK